MPKTSCLLRGNQKKVQYIHTKKCCDKLATSVSECVIYPTISKFYSIFYNTLTSGMLCLCMSNYCYFLFIWFVYAHVKLAYTLHSKSECFKMDFLLKTKIRGVCKIVKCNENDTNVFEFIAKGKL